MKDEFKPKITIFGKLNKTNIMVRTFLILLISVTSIININAQEKESEYVIFQKGLESLKEKDFYEAIEIFTQVIEQDSMATYAYTYRGFAKNGIKAYLDALEDFDKVIELEPENMKAYNDRGKAKLSINDTVGAIQDFEVVTYNDPNSAEAYISYIFLSKLYYNSKRYKLAIFAYSKIIENEPKNYNAHFMRGVCKDKLHNYTGAIHDYNSALLINPTFTQIYGNRGVSKINLIVKSKEKKNEEKMLSACNDLKRAKKYGSPVISQLLDKYCKSVEVNDTTK